MISLSELIDEVSLLINEITEHPEYLALVDKGYYPDLDLGDAHTALAYLFCTIKPPVITDHKISEVEVTHDSKA